jgi:hypothetical protein
MTAADGPRTPYILTARAVANAARYADSNREFDVDQYILELGIIDGRRVAGRRHAGASSPLFTIVIV